MVYLKSDHILVASCTHIPFEHPKYLDFLLDVKKRFKCGVFVHAGDLVDNHAISFFDTDPNGRSAADEMKEADKHLRRWFKAFPEAYLCRGNHDCLVDRKARTMGLPRRAFKAFRDIWDLPEGWDDDFGFTIDKVRYEHGTGRSGRYAHVQAAYDNRMSTVIGHLHSNAGIEWSANYKDRLFGMAVGCGIDRKKYAFTYGRDFKRKPLLSCAIVTDQGKYAQVIPMEI